MRKTPLAIIVQSAEDALHISELPLLVNYTIEIFTLDSDVPTVISRIDSGTIDGLITLVAQPHPGLTPLLAAAEQAQVPTTYSLHSVHTMAQRDMAKRVAMTHGMITPPFVTIYSATDLDLRAINLPCVVKPATTPFHRGVRVPNSFAELKESTTNAFELSRHVVIEEFIEGREFSVILYGNEETPTVLPAIEVICTASSLASSVKYATQQLSDKHERTIQNLGRRSWKIFGGQGIMRVDFIYDESEELFYFLEISTSIFDQQQAMLRTALAAQQLSFSDWLTELIQSQLAA